MQIKKSSTKRDKKTNKEIDYEDFGLSPGKLYTFNGNYRVLYSEKKPSYNNRSKKNYRIVRGDNLLFLEASFKECSKTARYSVYKYRNRSLKQLEEAEKARLRKNNNKFIKISPAMWNDLYYVTYERVEPVFKGRIRVAYKDIFGWVNISFLTKEKIKKQFSVVEL